ncbi:MAG: GDCCVxC domain-containing (seleno)protein [Rhizobiaceae bacterium]
MSESAAAIVATSILSCPICGHKSTQVMPTDACQFFHECSSCGTLLRPEAGDCCVFCSYGDMPCPPVQGAGRRADCC